VRALQFIVDNVPADCILNARVMNPERQWSILALAVTLGGHVRKVAADPQSLAFAVSESTLDHARVMREARVHHVLGISCQYY
jgi:hypothetical protein